MLKTASCRNITASSRITALAAAIVLPAIAFAQATDGSGSSGAGSYVAPGTGTTGPSGEYVPPQGEQPDYGKKYRPNTPSHDLILEINPLLVINRGIAVEGERRMGELVSLGLDLMYRDAEVFDRGGVRGRVQSFGAAPKVRVYPMSTLGGVFFGAKLMLSQNTLSITDNDDQSVFTVSPTAHVGYRVSTFGGFTLAAYLGGGINIPAPEYEKDDLDAAYRDSKDHNGARDKVNKATGLFRPDIGLTLGVAL